MRIVRIISLKDQRVISEKCVVADRFWVRLRGLIGKHSMSPSEGLWFPRCSSVHTWWMSMPIDVVFLRRSAKRSANVWEVTSVRSEVRPWRLLPLGDLKASETLELAAGAAKESGLSPGDEVECIV